MAQRLLITPIQLRALRDKNEATRVGDILLVPTCCTNFSTKLLQGVKRVIAVMPDSLKRLTQGFVEGLPIDDVELEVMLRVPEIDWAKANAGIREAGKALQAALEPVLAYLRERQEGDEASLRGDIMYGRVADPRRLLPLVNAAKLAAVYPQVTLESVRDSGAPPGNTAEELEAAARAICQLFGAPEIADQVFGKRP